MRLSDDLLTVFTAEIETREGHHVVTVPERELAIGDLDAGETYRVALLSQTDRTASTDDETAAPAAEGRSEHESAPPVEAGDTLDVEIEDVGDQGDGIARIGPGYVVFVPETDVGDRVTIDITEARDTFAFAEVVEHDATSG